MTTYEILKIEFVTSEGAQVTSLSDDGITGYHFLRFDKIANIAGREIRLGGHYRVTPEENGLKIELV